MTDAENMAVVRRYFSELWNKGKLELADELIAPGFGASEGGVVSGPEAASMYVSSYRCAFPNIHFRVLSLSCEGDVVTACWVGTGAHEPSEECAEGAARGRERTITGLSVYRLEDGKIAEMWLGGEALQQIGSGSRAGVYSRN